MSDKITPKLVVLPGVNSGAYLFDTCKAALDKACDAVMLNPPGVGKPPMLEVRLPFTAKAYAREVLRYMDLHNIWQADILGHSLGGFAAQELAHLAPQRVGKLILVSTSAGQPATMRDVALMAMKLRKSFWEFNQEIERNPHKALQVMFGPRYVTQHPHLYETFIKARSANLPGASVSLAHLSAGGAFSSVRWARKLEMPTLVIHGSDDALVSPVSGRELAAMIPNAQYIELHGVGHFPMLEHPHFWRYIKDFMAGQLGGLKLTPKRPNTFWERFKDVLKRHG